LGAYKLTGFWFRGSGSQIGRTGWWYDRGDDKMFNRQENLVLIFAHGRRFLGVNSVTNSGPDAGFLPVPIIRNEYWFEKFYIFRLAVASAPCRQKPVKRSKG
jgi:hypothetical protein